MIGRSGMPKNQAAVKSFSAIGRAGIDDDGYRAGTPKLRLDDMDRDGLARVGDLRAAVARLPDRRSRRCRTRATRRGTTGRSRSSTRSRPTGCACSRSCPATRPRPPRPSSSAAPRSATAARSSASSTSTLGDPAWDRLWAAARAHRAADQLPHQGRHVVEAELPDRQVAVGRVRDAAAAAARRAARDMVFCGALERHPGFTLVLAESGVGWLPYFLTRMDVEWHDAAATSSTTRRASRRASCSAAR